jgi:heme/copper-type cytochrome/quinol oxidase subunit 4
MKRLKSIKRKIIATLVFSILASIGAIIHGIFLDLDFSQIQRLSLDGFLVTFLVVFPSLLLLEWIFDLENHEEFKILEKRISNIEKKKR